MKLYITIVSFSILVLLSLCSEAHVSQQSPSTGFSVDLISREFSPLSPFYNPKATHFERLKNVIHRSNSRLSYLQSRHNTPSKSPDSISSTLQGSYPEYLMKLNIGTPPVEYLVIADTGSDLTWIQCKPCIYCFPQAYPLFDFRKSSSYKTLKCGSKCTKYLSTSDSSLCNTQKNKCMYVSHYGDGSYSVGDGATEKLTFGKTSIPNFVFGCGHINNYSFFIGMSSGIVGLGGGPSSLISQLDYIIHGKFSYCMVSYEKNETSTIRFGEGVQVFTPKAVLTPLYHIPDDTFFYVNLEKVIIGNKYFEFAWEMIIPQIQPGNMIIDSGSTLTQLPDGAFYKEIVYALKEYIGLKTIDDPEKLGYNLCYETSPKIKVPYIAFQFTGGTLSIPNTRAFIEVATGVTCFSIISTDKALLGNILQQNLLVSYDLYKNMVSFLPTDCSKKQ